MSEDEEDRTSGDTGPVARSDAGRRGPRRGARSRAREMALQALYQCVVGGGDVHWAIEQFSRDPVGGPADVVFFRELVLGVWSRLDELDGMIAGAAHHWAPERLSVIDRNVLRLGIYELLYQRDLPVRVVMNEAIELSKRFGGEDSGRFVNGILDRVAADVRGGADPVAGLLPEGD
ncbi:MAG: transcription antitermination factor NusB [Magnetococcus sp. WYHC-3]